MAYIAPIRKIEKPEEKQKRNSMWASYKVRIIYFDYE